MRQLPDTAGSPLDAERRMPASPAAGCLDLVAKKGFEATYLEAQGWDRVGVPAFVRQRCRQSW